MHSGPHASHQLLRKVIQLCQGTILQEQKKLVRGSCLYSSSYPGTTRPCVWFNTIKDSVMTLRNISNRGSDPGAAMTWKSWRFGLARRLRMLYNTQWPAPYSDALLRQPDVAWPGGKVKSSCQMEACVYSMTLAEAATLGRRRMVSVQPAVATSGLCGGSRPRTHTAPDSGS